MTPPTPTSTARPLPRRINTLQHVPFHGPLTPLRSTPKSYTYPTPSSPSSPKSPSSLAPTAPRTPTRPGAPKRSHSFCGDTSASTYALASTSASTHLSPNKDMLVAVPLERTISSIGSRGNLSPPGQQMPRPGTRPFHAMRSSVSAPPTPPASPHKPPSLPPVPQIILSTPTPPRARPGLNPIQHTQNAQNPGDSPTRASTTRQVSSLSAISRASSYALVTPAEALFDPMDRPADGAQGKELVSRGGFEDEDEMMEVDEMVERVEEMVV